MQQEITNVALVNMRDDYAREYVKPAKGTITRRVVKPPQLHQDMAGDREWQRKARFAFDDAIKFYGDFDRALVAVLLEGVMTASAVWPSKIDDDGPKPLTAFGVELNEPPKDPKENPKEDGSASARADDVSSQ